ncbi:MAG: tetratricopeptide repeat protein, partial [Candidatus Lokiarchaeota archaeon]|nr:tetratricopeptide repeat protein [Candidatus Lokiarchaeota archaeon]
KAKILGALKDFNESLNCYNLAIKINSNNFDVLRGKAIILQQIGDHKQAMELYKKVISEQPNDKISLKNLANIYNNKNMMDEEIKCYERILKIDPKDKISPINLSRIYFKKREFDKALKTLDNAIKIDQNDDLWVEKALILANQNKISEALSCIKKTLELNPNNEKAIILKSELNKQIKNFNSDTMKKLGVKLNERNKSIDLCKKGFEFWNKDNYKKALSLYNKAIKADSNNIDAWCGKAVTLTSLKKHDDAIICCDNVINIKSDLAFAWIVKAINYYYLEDFSEASSSLNMAVLLDPNIDIDLESVGYKLDYFYNYYRKKYR